MTLKKNRGIGRVLSSGASILSPFLVGFSSILFFSVRSLVAQQVASSTSFLLFAADVNGGASPVTTPADFRISSPSYKTYTNTGSAIASGTDVTSLNFLLQAGFEYSVNIPPTVITNANRFPTNPLTLYTTTPPFTVENAGDLNPKDTLHFRIEVASDSAFTQTIYNNVSESNGAGWELSQDGGSTFSAFPDTGISQDLTADLIRHTAQAPLFTPPAATALYWRAYALDDFEFSFPSTPFSLTLSKPQVPLTSPQNQQILGNPSLTVSWTPVDGANQYELTLAQQDDFSDGTTSFTTSTSFPLGPLLDGRYFLRIRALDVLGNPSDFSPLLTFFISTIPVVGVKLQAAVPITGPGSSVLLTASLVGPNGQTVTVFSVQDFTFTIPTGTGTLGNPLLFSDRVEIPYNTAALVEAATIQVQENRSGKNFTDSVTITTFGGLIVLNDLYNPKNINLLPSQETVIFSFKLLSTAEDALVTEFYIDFSFPKSVQLLGTLNLVEDVNQNGLYDPGIDRLVATATRTNVDSSLTFFKKLQEIVPRGTSIHYLVTAVFQAPLQSLPFSAQIDPLNAVVGTGVTSGMFLNTTGETVTSGPNTLLSASAAQNLGVFGTGVLTLSDRYEKNNAFSVPALSFSVAASPYNNLLLQSLTLNAFGSGRDTVDILAVHLYEDVDQNGLLTPADRLLGSGKYSANDGFLTFSNLNLLMAKGQALSFLATYDLSGQAATGSILESSIKKIGVSAVNPQTNTSIAFLGPDRVDGTLIHIQNTPPGSILVQSLPLNHPPSTLNPGSTETLFHFIVSNSSIEAVTLTSIKTTLLTPSSNFRFFTSLTLVEDMNQNGQYDSGIDLPLSTQYISSATPALTFSGLSVPMAPSETQHFLIQATLNGTVPTPFVVRLLIRSNSDVVATGSPVTTLGAPTGGSLFLVEASQGSSGGGGGNSNPGSQPIASSGGGSGGGGGGGGGCYTIPIRPGDYNQGAGKNFWNGDIVLAFLFGYVIIALMLRRRRFSHT